MTTLKLWADGSRWNTVNPLIVKDFLHGMCWKSTSGDYFPDPKYADVQTGFHSQGILTASYHWNDPLSSVSKQVDFAVKTIEPYMDQQEFIAVDQEQWWSDWGAWNAWRAGLIAGSEVPKLSPDKISDTGEAICGLLKQKTGKKIILYTNAYFVLDYSPQMLNWINNYPNWYSQYPYNRTLVYCTWEQFLASYTPTSREPAFPASYADKTWDAWQFTGDKFFLPGVDGSIDLNYIKSDFLGLPDPTPDPTPEPEPVLGSALISAGINIRTFAWGDDWGNTDKTIVVPIEDDVIDKDGKHWYKIPAYIASWTVKKV